MIPHTAKKNQRCGPAGGPGGCPGGGTISGPPAPQDSRKIRNQVCHSPCARKETKEDMLRVTVYCGRRQATQAGVTAQSFSTCQVISEPKPVTST